MQPADGPTKVCPQCQSKVFESETVCGFCGHMFASEANPSATSGAPEVAPTGTSLYSRVWPQTYYYQKWGSGGLYTSVAVAAVVAACAGVAFTVMALQRNPESQNFVIGFDAVAFVVIFGGCVAISQFAQKASITLQADRVEWTTLTGKQRSVRNSELNYGYEFSGSKQGKGYVFGTKDGPTCNVRSALEGFDDVVAELKRWTVN